MSDDLVKPTSASVLLEGLLTLGPSVDGAVERDLRAGIEALEAENARLIAERAADNSRLKIQRDNALLDMEDFMNRADAAESAYGDLTSYIEGWTSPSEMKQRAGEMTAQEVRTVQAILSAILDRARSSRAFVQQHEGKK